VGGSNAGQLCTSANDCPGGFCKDSISPQCGGGEHAGESCSSTFDCVEGDGVCDLSATVGCASGPYYGQTCTCSRDCVAGCSCPCPTEGAEECIYPANPCWAGVIGVCDGGANDDQPCLADGCEGGSCGGYRCVGGANDGLCCISDTDCPGGGDCPRWECVGGSNAGMACTINAQCAVGGGTCQGPACSGGSNDGQRCYQCDHRPGGTCDKSGLCDGGFNDGQTCWTDFDCQEWAHCDLGTNQCVFGPQSGQSCTGDGDCPNHPCTTFVANRSRDSSPETTGQLFAGRMHARLGKKRATGIEDAPCRRHCSASVGNGVFRRAG